jgi:hypothetical protein
MMIKKLSVAAIMMLLSSPVATIAEEISLNNGTTMQGKIIERSDKWIKVNANGVDVTYYLDEIRLIDGQTVNSLIAEPPKILKSQPVLNSDNLDQSFKTIEAVQVAEPSEPMSSTMDQSMNTDDQVMVQSMPVKSVSSAVYAGKGFKSSRKMIPAQAVSVVLITIAVVGLVFLVAFYPVFLIAKKTNTAYPYFAFIPLLNYYLLCKISGRPVWWIILYLIPLVNWVVDVMVWMDIAKIRQKPAWLGVLVLIPLANIGMIWYLALSDPPKV